MYPEDFTTPDAAYVPVDDTLFLGMPPLLAGLLLLILLGVAFAAWRMGRDASGSARRDDAAPAEIHKAILAASSAAIGASSNELKAKAQVLRDRIDELLGPVLALAKGLSPAVKALDDALKGEKKVEARPAPAPGAQPGDGGTKAARCGCTGEACTCGSTAGPVTVNQVYIGGAAVAACGCDGKGAHKPDCAHGPSPKGEAGPPPKTETAHMTGPEQIEALARAVRQFHDHWLDGPARVRELNAARAALSRRPPAAMTRSAGHGHGH